MILQKSCCFAENFLLKTAAYQKLCPEEKISLDGHTDKVCAIFNLREPFANLTARQRLGSHFKGRLVGFLHCLMDHRRHQRTHRKGEDGAAGLLWRLLRDETPFVCRFKQLVPAFVRKIICPRRFNAK